MAAVATPEVYFDRSEKRADGRQELASLFNPYSQVHLVANSPAVLATAIAKQSGSMNGACYVDLALKTAKGTCGAQMGTRARQSSELIPISLRTTKR